jgi:hypothetical protein
MLESNTFEHSVIYPVITCCVEPSINLVPGEAIIVAEDIPDGTWKVMVDEYIPGVSVNVGVIIVIWSDILL